MALYDGFFDSVYNEETGEYDRAYDSGDFVGYYDEIIGSGVCVYDNLDSFRVSYSSGNAVVAPGYLFISGYWLKNDANYNVPLSTPGVYAILAHLNTGSRLIEVIAQEKASPEVYPNSLVLAYITVNYTMEGSVVDTRYNTSICGVIDPMGELNDKVAYAVHYIDTEIEGRLDEAEAEIHEQQAILTARIAEVSAEVEKLEPPPIGSIKFSASENVGAEWLPCDGRFVNESQYPDLVAALGKLTPSGDKFQLISSGEIGAQISNGVVYGGRFWVYSYSAGKLYGVDIEGNSAIKEISVTSDEAEFSNFQAPSEQHPIALSIVENSDGVRLFIGQIVEDGYLSSSNWKTRICLFSAEFSGNETTISVSCPVASISSSSGAEINAECTTAIPYVVSKRESGVEYYYCMLGSYLSYAQSSGGIKFRIGEDSEHVHMEYKIASSGTYYNLKQRTAFSKKTLGDAVSIILYYIGSDVTKKNYYCVQSTPFGNFDRLGLAVNSFSPTNNRTPMYMAGYDDVAIIDSTSKIGVFRLSTDYCSTASTGVNLPNGSRLFNDGSAYLWGKDIYMIFVGTGIIFSRDLATFGFLNTIDVLGNITQFGYLDYSQDENTLYLLGQDTTNTVKVAKMELNTLYDYANDGAWLPMIASDGVPAYIKALEET